MSISYFIKIECVCVCLCACVFMCVCVRMCVCVCVCVCVFWKCVFRKFVLQKCILRKCILRKCFSESVFYESIFSKSVFPKVCFPKVYFTKVYSPKVYCKYRSILGPNFFPVTRPKLFQNEHTQRLAHLPSFCELVPKCPDLFKVQWLCWRFVQFLPTWKLKGRMGGRQHSRKERRLPQVLQVKTPLIATSTGDPLNCYKCRHLKLLQVQTPQIATSADTSYCLYMLKVMFGSTGGVKSRDLTFFRHPDAQFRRSCEEITPGAYHFVSPAGDLTGTFHKTMCY